MLIRVSAAPATAASSARRTLKKMAKGDRAAGAITKIVRETAPLAQAAKEDQAETPRDLEGVADLLVTVGQVEIRSRAKRYQALVKCEYCLLTKAPSVPRTSAIRGATFGDCSHHDHGVLGINRNVKHFTFMNDQAGRLADTLFNLLKLDFLELCMFFLELHAS